MAELDTFEILSLKETFLITSDAELFYLGC
jgi:hypothetical protein